MTLSKATLDELRLLSMFNPESTLAGIKVHHTASPDDIAATQRLYDKGLITLVDGGYLTSLGQDAIRHLDAVTTILTTESVLD